MNIRKLGAFAVLWLTLTVAATAAPVLYNNPGLSVTQTLSVLGGGIFSGSLDNGPAFNVYCIDYLNGFITPDAVWQSDSNDLSKTRYFGTADASFLPLLGHTNVSVLQRYVMAAWLTTQYVAANGGGDANNQGIQSAIWSIMDVTTNPQPPTGGNVATWETNAYNILGTSTYTSILANMRILTSTNVALLQNANGTPAGDRYQTNGSQEFIYVSSVPEPASLMLIGSGLALVGLIRRKRSA